jgi:hypothetical protein
LVALLVLSTLALIALLVLSTLPLVAASTIPSVTLPILASLVRPLATIGTSLGSPLRIRRSPRGRLGVATVLRRAAFGPDLTVLGPPHRILPLVGRITGLAR